MRRSQLSFLFILCGIILAAAFPNAYAADAGFEELRKNAAQIKTIQADFIQKKSMKILTKPLISEGRFYYTAPDSFRWEYLKPLKSIVINHKGQTKRYIYSGGKMVEDQSGGAQGMKVILGEITSWMSGKFDQNPSFKATLKEDTYTQITLTPVGQNMDGMLQKVIITISKKDAAVKSVNIIESETSSTVIDFKNTQTNKNIPESIFQDIE
ncbi:MAG: outer membrane lipoprotein carrier protein LolA [Syntrophaceae bacterium]|nr:outer membrane lipoprotein carrier protein LolA [Syntrophaceae bacterium]